MKILYRYIFIRFWAPFFGGLGIFVAMILFASLIDKLNVFIKSDENVFVFLKYIVLQIPYFAVQSIPIATLLAVLFSLRTFISRGEWKAGLAGGFNPISMLVPVLFCSFVVVIFHSVVQEIVVPPFYKYSAHLYREKFEQRADRKKTVRSNISFTVGNDSFISARIFDLKHRIMENVILDIYENEKLSLEVHADKAYWDDGIKRWVFTHGILRKYTDKKPVSENFKDWRSDISIEPKNLVLDTLIPEGISLKNLSKRIKRLKIIGASVVNEKILYYSKISWCLSNLVMAMIGIVFIFLIPQTGKLLNFGFALFFGFFFWAVMLFGESLGRAEIISPVIAGFGPLVLFFLASVFGIKKTKIIS